MDVIVDRTNNMALVNRCSLIKLIKGDPLMELFGKVLIAISVAADETKTASDYDAIIKSMDEILDQHQVQNLQFHYADEVGITVTDAAMICLHTTVGELRSTPASQVIFLRMDSPHVGMFTHLIISPRMIGYNARFLDNLKPDEPFDILVAQPDQVEPARWEQAELIDGVYLTQVSYRKFTRDTP